MAYCFYASVQQIAASYLYSRQDKLPVMFVLIVDAVLVTII